MCFSIVLLLVLQVDLAWVASESPAAFHENNLYHQPPEISVSTQIQKIKLFKLGRLDFDIAYNYTAPLTAIQQQETKICSYQLSSTAFEEPEGGVEWNFLMQLPQS